MNNLGQPELLSFDAGRREFQSKVSAKTSVSGRGNPPRFPNKKAAQNWAARKAKEALRD
jgi:hypothetical protein